jgi:hypothetical protein
VREGQKDILETNGTKTNAVKKYIFTAFRYICTSETFNCKYTHTYIRNERRRRLERYTEERQTDRETRQRRTEKKCKAG